MGTKFKGNALIVAAKLSYFSSVKEIDSEGFYGCTKLSSIDIPESVTTIGAQAFRNCTFRTFNFKNIQILKQYAFISAPKLEEVILNEGFTTLQGQCFRECGALTYLELPTTITEVGYWNWPNSNQIVICKATNPPNLSSTYAGNNRGTVYVPDEAYNDYIVATNWSNLYSRGLIKKRSELPEDYKSRWP